MSLKETTSPGAAEQRTAYDEFSAAFAEIEAATGDEPSTSTPAAQPAAVVTPTPAEPVPVAATPAPAADAGAALPTEPAAATPEPASAAAPAAAPSTDDVAARLAALEAENAALKARTPAPAAEPIVAPVAEPAVADAPPVEPQWYAFNDEEKALISKYETDWGDVAKAEAVRRKAEIFNAVTYVFAQMRQHIEPKLKEFSEISELVTNQLALQDLRRVNNDYDTIYDAVVAWTDTLPIPFKAGAKQVLESGTTEEVNALITEFRKSHSATAPATAPAAAASAASAGGSQGTANLSPAAKQAAQRLSVVGSKRSVQRGSAVDPNDFEGAWDEAMREGNA